MMMFSARSFYIVKTRERFDSLSASVAHSASFVSHLLTVA